MTGSFKQSLTFNFTCNGSNLLLNGTIEVMLSRQSYVKKTNQLQFVKINNRIVQTIAYRIINTQVHRYLNLLTDYMVINSASKQS